MHENPRKKNEERERDYLWRCRRSTGKREREGRWSDGGEGVGEREVSVKNGEEPTKGKKKKSPLLLL